MLDKSDITKKILNLRNMTSAQGASEQEAAAAFKIAARLMKDNQITEADLVNIEVSRDTRAGLFQHTIKTKHPCNKWCSHAIGQFCEVITWYDPSVGGSRCFGFNADVDMYEYLMKLVHDSMDRSWKEYININPPRPGVSRHTEYWNFMAGFATRVIDRLKELMNPPETSGSFDVVEYKRETLLAEIERVLPGLKLRQTKSRSIAGDADSFTRGKHAGSNVNLNRPVGAGAGAQKRLS